MPKSYLQPGGDRVLVIDKEQKNILGDMELPDNVRQLDMVYGYVIAVGPLSAPRVKPEETVCYGPYAGKLVNLEGVQFRILREGQIEAWIRQRSTEEETHATRVKEHWEPIPDGGYPTLGPL